MRLGSLMEMRAWATDFATRFQRPCIVLLDGELGSGKTQAVRYFLAALGVTDSASPTFAIHHEYRSATGPIDHVDLYRVRSDADLEATGFWDLLTRDQGLVFVEWASRLPEDVWPESWQRIFIHFRKVDGRDVDGQDEVRDVDVRIRPPAPEVRRES
jgi:tRNA threonylcarbamoyladenosine biosynthesis protein TsaE